MLKYVFWAFIYLPVFCVGYHLSNLAMSPVDRSLHHLVTALLFSYGVYLFIFFLKGLLLSLKERGNRWWIFLFLFCVVFTCLLSPYFVVGPLFGTLLRWHFSSWLTWVLTVAFGLLIYTKYKFLAPSAPALARFAFELGRRVARKTCYHKL